jgi:RNA polymerase sigma-70 factor (ECF subfamily)
MGHDLNQFGVQDVLLVEQEVASVSMRAPIVTRRRQGRSSPPPGDEAFVRALYAEHGALLLGYVIRLTGDRQLAEDIVQETLVRAWRNSGQLAEHGSVRAWLLTVARNLTVDAVRARRVRPVEVDAEMAESGATQTMHADHGEAVATGMVVAAAMATLSSEHRDALLAVYFHDKTAAAASEVLGISPGTVKSRVHYALKALRQVMTDPQGAMT